MLYRNRKTELETNYVEISGLIKTVSQKIFEDTFLSYGVTYIKEHLQNVILLFYIHGLCEMYFLLHYFLLLTNSIFIKLLKV